ncbi:MAG: hypothetical protein AVDCRST_MAG90-2209, partial [uncultured Microvirga sp.]
GGLRLALAEELRAGILDELEQAHGGRSPWRPPVRPV